MRFLEQFRSRFFRTWPVAAAALGGLLLLIATSVLSTSRKAEEIYDQLDQLNTHHRVVESKLRRLRADLHLSGIYIRDYLLDTDSREAPEYRKSLTDLRNSQMVVIGELRSLTPPGMKPRIDNLQQHVDEYWQAFEPLFQWTAIEKIAFSVRFLRREVIPRREAVLNITREIEKLNDANLAAQRAEVARREASFRDDLYQRLIRTLLIGLLVAVVAVMRLRSLEHRARRQRLEALQAEQEMRLLSQQLVAAQEEERKKLSRELHDHVGQMLTALRMEIGRAARARGNADTQTGQALLQAKYLLDTILRSVRDLVMGLRPSMLDDFGLQPALEWHIRDFRRRFNMKVELNVSGDINALPDQHRTAVYRIVQEALTNCARHSQARRVDIAVRHAAHALELTIADDGVGIDPRRARGMGLIGMEERARELSGTLRVGRGAQGGTELHVVLPIEEAKEEAELARAAG